MSSKKVVQASRPSRSSVAPAPLDRLSDVLDRFRVRAHLFHTGPMCGISNFDARPGRAFLHVLRRGTLRVTHPRLPGLRRELRLSEPALLLYPRAVAHVFHNLPREGSDFTCATLDFEGGDRHPLVAALPPLVTVPLRRVEGLEPALDLLFSETDRVRCGARLLADRLFEVVLIQVLRWLLDHPEEAGVSAGLVAGMSDARLARALVAIHRVPAHAWSVESMAREAGMSRAAFAAAFRSVVGRTPVDYLTDWRLTVALDALRARRPVKVVAGEVGYGSAAALSKAFRERLGASPRLLLALEGPSARR